MSGHHLLLIEDNADIVDYLQADLEDAGYRVTSAFSLARARLLVQEAHPDLIVTDLGLPDGDGEEIVTGLRSEMRVPVIVLTARDDADARERLLAAGADAYLVKPFDTPTLLGRIAGLLRRAQVTPFTLGPLQYRPGDLTARLDGQEVTLGPAGAVVLTALLRHPGRLVPGETLLHDLQARGETADPQALEDTVADLQRRLRLGGTSLIRRVRGVGYACTVPQPQVDLAAT